MRKDLTTAKTLLVASITALSMTGAYASENLAPVPKVAEDNPQGTLDKLAGQDIPGSDPVQQYPSSGSSYTLTKVQEGGEKPTGDNIVTKFTYNSETQTMTPVYYKLDLKQTTYGEGNTSQTFTLDTEPVKGVEITAKYDDLSGKTYDNEYKDTNYTATVTEGGSYNSPRQEIHSALQNASGETTSIENAIFKDNKMEIDFSTSNTYYLDVIGGAIYNAGTIEKITADFLNNSVTANTTGRNGYSYAKGGAIYNDGAIENIAADFLNNSVSAINTGSFGSPSAYGGAIYNAGTIADITGDFIGNYASSSSYAGARGGAIYNYNGTIGDITGDFIGNYASSSNGDAYGGAIYNSGTIGDITGDFIGNYGANGGAIYNVNQMDDITGDFIGNYASSLGGAIYNEGTIADITGGFIGNYAFPSSSFYAEIKGGAIYNNYDGTIGNITGDFIGNSASSSGGAIYNYDGTIGNITGDFINNRAQYGGAIFNDSGAIDKITGNFINNSGTAIYNTQIYDRGPGIINNIKGDFINNVGDKGGVILTGISEAFSTYYGHIVELSGNFVANKATNSGGAIYIGNVDYSWSDKNIGIGTIKNSSFIGNSANGYGGAIFSRSNVNIVSSDGYQSVFKGNYTESNGVKDDNAIYLDNSEVTLSFKMTNGGSIYMADNIDGKVEESEGTITSAYNVDIQGDNKDNTTFYMLNDIRNADVTVGNTTLNTINNQSHTYNFNSFTLTDNTNMLADVDLANESMDKIEANSYGEHQGNLHVVGMNMLSDAPENRDVTDIYFAQVGNEYVK